MPVQTHPPVAEPALPILQRVKRHCVQAVYYQSYGLENCSMRYDNIVSSYVNKMMKEAKSQMNEHVFDRSDPILIIGFLAIVRVAFNTNYRYKGVAVWVFPFFVKFALPSTLNSRMSVATNIAPTTVSIHLAVPSL